MKYLLIWIVCGMLGVGIGSNIPPKNGISAAGVAVLVAGGFITLTIATVNYLAQVKTPCVLNCK